MPVTKVWNNRDGIYGEKEVLLNPNTEMRTLEDCKLKDKNGKEINCTQITYPNGDYIKVPGTKQEFIAQCRECNTMVGLLVDLYNQGYTIKSFLLEQEPLNGA